MDRIELLNRLNALSTQEWNARTGANQSRPLDYSRIFPVWAERLRLVRELAELDATEKEVAT